MSKNEKRQPIDDLSTSQAKAVTSLLNGCDIATAAQEAGVGRATVYRWVKEDAGFQAALKGGQREAVETAVRRLSGGLTKALDTFMELMGPDNNPNIRHRASQAWVDTFARLGQYADFDERLGTIEERLEALRTAQYRQGAPAYWSSFDQEPNDEPRIKSYLEEVIDNDA